MDDLGASLSAVNSNRESIVETSLPEDQATQEIDEVDQQEQSTNQYMELTQAIDKLED